MKTNRLAPVSGGLAIVAACALAMSLLHCSAAQTGALTASLAADEKCIAARTLADLNAGMSWENACIDILAVCGEQAVVNYEANLGDAGKAPSILATAKAAKASRK